MRNPEPPSDTSVPAERRGLTERAREHTRSQQLANLFIHEPELIQACLQDVEPAAPATTQRVLAAARMALAECPDYADLLYYSAQAALAADDPALAARWLARARRRNPGYRDALILAARVALLRKRPREATALLERAVGAGADYPDVHMLLGRGWQARGDQSRARAAYERALALNSNFSAAREALATLVPPFTAGKCDELSA